MSDCVVVARVVNPHAPPSKLAAVSRARLQAWLSVGATVRQPPWPGWSPGLTQGSQGIWAAAPLPGAGAELQLPSFKQTHKR